MKLNIYIFYRGSPVNTRGRGRRNTSVLTVSSVRRRRRSRHRTPLGCGSRGSARICVSCSRRHAQGTQSSYFASRTSTCDRHSSNLPLSSCDRRRSRRRCSASSAPAPTSWCASSAPRTRCCIRLISCSSATRIFISTDCGG